MCRLGMNGRTFSQNLRKRGKSHHHPITHPPSQHSANGSLSFSVRPVHSMLCNTQQMGLSPFLCNPCIPCFTALRKWVSLPFCATRSFHALQQPANGTNPPCCTSAVWRAKFMTHTTRHGWEGQTHTHTLSLSL